MNNCPAMTTTLEFELPTRECAVSLEERLDAAGIGCGRVGQVVRVHMRGLPDSLDWIMDVIKTWSKNWDLETITSRSSDGR
jgi:hypothetical protein